MRALAALRAGLPVTRLACRLLRNEQGAYRRFFLTAIPKTGNRRECILNHVVSSKAKSSRCRRTEQSALRHAVVPLKQPWTDSEEL